MSRVARFEDLTAWQKARELTRLVYEETREGSFARDYGLAGQIQRAAVSIMSNIAEGAERSGSSELHHFLTIANGSCGEVRSQLYVAYDVGYLDQARFDNLLALAEETARVIAGLRSAVDRSRTAKA